MSHLLLGSISKFFCVSYSFLNLWICYETQPTNTKIQIQIQRSKLTKQVFWDNQVQLRETDFVHFTVEQTFPLAKVKNEKNENNKKFQKFPSP